MDEQQRIEIKEVDGVTIVHFKDEKIVEDLGIEELGQQLFDLVDVDNREKIILNFASVDFLSSAALGKLITLDTKVKSRGGTIAFCNVRPEIYEVFAITRLSRVFDIKDDEAEALAIF